MSATPLPILPWRTGAEAIWWLATGF